MEIVSHKPCPNCSHTNYIEKVLASPIFFFRDPGQKSFGASEKNSFTVLICQNCGNSQLYITEIPQV